MTKKQTKKSVFLIFAILIAMLLSFLPLASWANVAYAEDEATDIRYTNVLVDLYKAENFNVEDFPKVEDDYSLKVIQIAESNNNELFVYVYNPSADRVATSISISTAEDRKNPQFKLYDLTLLNSYEVFSKYKVEGLSLKNTATRYYEIPEIFRTWDENVDKKTSPNTMNARAFEVAKIWTAYTSADGSVIYDCAETETIVVTNKRVGFVSYDEGFKLKPTSCCSHYVAFSTNKKMDQLLEADVDYVYQGCTGKILDTGIWPITWESNGEKKKNTVTLKYDEEVSNSADGWFAKKYTWKRIEKASDFIADKDNKLKDSTIEELKGMQWVLRFLETDTVYTSYPLGYREVKFTEVSEVTILRLKFKTNGQTFNLGVVDNKQTGSKLPDNNNTSLKWFEEIFEWITNNIKLILIVIVSCVALVFVVWVLKSIFGKGGK